MSQTKTNNSPDPRPAFPVLCYCPDSLNSFRSNLIPKHKTSATPNNTLLFIILFINPVLLYYSTSTGGAKKRSSP